MTREKTSSFKGTGVAIVTPFYREGNIDFKSFEKLIDYQIAGGIDYLVFMGTTGESVTLNKDERCAIINFAVEITNGRVPVVIGIGSNNTQQVVNSIRETNFDAISGILSVSPYYNKPQPKGIYMHYKAIAAECPVPIIMYNVPGRTGSNVDAETTLKIAHEISGIVAVKEASGNLAQCAKIIAGKPEGFLLISGDDALTYPLMALGADGVISVIANAYPAEFSQMVKSCLNNDYESARKLYYQLLNVMEAIFAEGSPSGIKALLEIKGLIKNHLRLPLVKINKSLYTHLSALAEKI